MDSSKLINIPRLGGVEKGSIAVTAILFALGYLMGFKDLAVGIAAGGVLFTANFVVIGFIVTTIITKSYPTSFGIFVLVVKMAILIAIAACTFIFAKVNLYGFFIGITGVVIVIIGESLRAVSTDK